MTRKLIALSFLIISIIIPFFLYGQTSEFRIDSTSTMDGHNGYKMSSLNNGAVYETDFIFEENGFVRLYAFNNLVYSSFMVLPDSTYWAKTNSMSIGNSWTSWIGQPTTAIVTDTLAVTVPAGTFSTYVVKNYLKSKPDSVIGIFYFSKNVGWVKMMVRGGVSGLTSYSILGGSGYFPLAIGNSWHFSPIATGVKDQAVQLQPTNFSLNQNYPNPFNPITTITFSIPSKSFITLKVFDFLGREVSTIISEELPSGNHTRQWNAMNFASGIYFYRLQTVKFNETKKLILLK